MLKTIPCPPFLRAYKSPQHVISLKLMPVNKKGESTEITDLEWTLVINKVIKASIGLGKEKDKAKSLSADYLPMSKDIKI